MLANMTAVIVCFVIVDCMGQSSVQSNPCAATEQQQFQFWVGEWDLTWPAEKSGELQRGTNSIRRTLDDCIVEENFSGGADMPLRGKSFSVFDIQSGKWKQTWVDNQGSYLDFVGEFRDGQMTLIREFRRPEGTRVMQRMVWKNIRPDELDWSWERSTDDGKTWNVLWPIHYKRRK